MNFWNELNCAINKLVYLCKFIDIRWSSKKGLFVGAFCQMHLQNIILLFLNKSYNILNSSLVNCGVYIEFDHIQS